ncbi:MAG: hypothetical protein IE932_02110 [Sphingopyxis terrae]|nr:hypothetical protein [Sphingopyxis terrae]
MSFLSQVHGRLMDEGIAPKRSRHILQVPFRKLPWFGLRLRWANRVLAKIGRRLDKNTGPVVRIPMPKLGQILEIGFLITDADPIKINNIDFVLGSVKGGGRSLVIIGKFQEHDPEEFFAAVNADLNRVPLGEKQIALMQSEKDASVHLYGTGDDGELTVTEVHNVSHVEKGSKAAR